MLTKTLKPGMKVTDEDAKAADFAQEKARKALAAAQKAVETAKRELMEAGRICAEVHAAIKYNDGILK